MNWFRRAGEKFEETKQAFTSAAETEFVCRACEKALTEHYEECPYCHEDAVEAVT